MPAGFDAWFAKATHRDPEQRFQTAKELEAALHTVCGASPRNMPPIQRQSSEQTRAPTFAGVTGSPESPPVRFRRVALVAGATLAASLAMGLGVNAYMLRPHLAPHGLHALAPAVNSDPSAAPPSGQTASAETAVAYQSPAPSVPIPLASVEPAPPLTDALPSAVTVNAPLAPRVETSAPSPSPKKITQRSKKLRRASPSIEPQSSAPPEESADKPSIVRDY